jgi:MFS family permease
MSAALIGGAVIQVPLGRLSDRVDRRWMLAATAAGAGAVATLLDLWRPADLAAALALLFLLGGCIFSLYGLAVAHANDRAHPEAFVETASGLLLLFGIGSIVGPLLASVAMGLLRQGALLTFMTSVHLSLAAYALWRILRTPAVPRAEREHFGAVPRNATPAAVALDPRANEPESLAAAPAVAATGAAAATALQRETGATGEPANDTAPRRAS